MRLNEYKEALREVIVDTDKIKDRFEKNIQKIPNKNGKRKSNFPKLFIKRPIVFGLTSLIIIFCVIFIDFMDAGKVSDFSIKVYAADKKSEQLLSDKPVSISLSNDFKMAGFSNDEIGNINFNLNFICEGDNIENITYQLSDQEITVYNKQQEVAWFVENDSYLLGATGENDVDQIIDEDEMINEGIYESFRDDKMCFVTKMIGNKYSVKGTDQNNKHYGLVINLFKDDKDEFTARNFIITVSVTLTDGTVIKKYISVEPYVGDLLNYKTSEDMPKLQMSLKD